MIALFAAATVIVAVAAIAAATARRIESALQVSIQRALDAGRVEGYAHALYAGRRR